MRILLQRVEAAAVTAAGEELGAIGAGLLTLVGFTHDDDLKTVDFLAEKCANLRIFEDGAGKMNRSLLDTGGAMLIVSQFTLYGNAERGRRPDFIAAARPDVAIPLYEAFIAAVRTRNVPVATGRFGAEMKVRLINDGPVTLMLEK